MMSPTKKTKIQNFPIFKNTNWKTRHIFREVEQLSILIPWRIMIFSQNGQGYLLRDLIFYSNFVFLAITFELETLDSQAKALKTHIIA